MEGITPPVYKPWLHYPNSSSSSLVASGMEIGLPPGTTPPRSPLQNSSKALPPIPIHQSSARSSLEDPTTEEACAQLETKSPFPIRNFPLERVQDLPTPPSPRSPTSRRSTSSTGSSRKIRQLTGLDLNIGNNLPLDDSDSVRDPTSPTHSASSSGSMYSQPGADYDLASAGYLAQRSVAPRSSGILLQSSTYQSPKQMHMNRQPPRALRHTDRPNTPQKAKAVPIVRPENVAEISILREIVFQEQQQQDLGYDAGYSQEVKHALAYPPMAELEDTEIEAGALMPRPLTIRTKKKPTQSPSKFLLFQSAADSWTYGINELISASTTNLNMTDHSRPSSSNTRGSTPDSPMGSMESDHIILPPIPDTPLMPNKRFGSGKHPLKSLFPFSSKTHEESDRVPSRTEHKPTRRMSGKLIGRSGAKPPIRNKARKPDELDKPIVSKGVFTGLQVLQKGNEHFQEVVERTREKVLKKSADERRRERLKGKIVVIGVPDQSPDGRVSEWL